MNNYYVTLNEDCAETTIHTDLPGTRDAILQMEAGLNRILVSNGPTRFAVVADWAVDCVEIEEGSPLVVTVGPEPRGTNSLNVYLYNTQDLTANALITILDLIATSDVGTQR